MKMSRDGKSRDGEEEVGGALGGGFYSGWREWVVVVGGKQINKATSSASFSCSIFLFFCCCIGSGSGAAGMRRRLPTSPAHLHTHLHTRLHTHTPRETRAINPHSALHLFEFDSTSPNLKNKNFHFNSGAESIAFH